MTTETRWPETLQPAECKFGRMRNDAILESPTSRKRQIVRRGRPVWNASITWRVLPHRVSEARYQMERLRGGADIVRLRDYGDRPEQMNGVQFTAAAERMLNSETSGLAIDFTSAEFADTGHYGSAFIRSAVGARALLGDEEEGFAVDFTSSEFSSTGHYGAAMILVAGADITVRTVAAAGATSVATQGWYPSVSMVLKAGQYVEIKERLYLVANDVMSDISGNATLTLTTPLLDSLVVGDDVEVTTPRARMRPTSPDWSGSRSVTEGLWTLSAEFVESVA